MIVSEILTTTYIGGEIQRTQCVRFDSFSQLHFYRPTHRPQALAEVARIYQRYMVPECPWIFGQLVLFRLPVEDALIDSLSSRGKKDALRSAAALLQKGLRFSSGRVRFQTDEAGKLYTKLQQAGCVEHVPGKLPFTRVVPMGDEAGYLSDGAQNDTLRVNASFFLLDPFDCASRYDVAGTPFGLAVEDGRVLFPPLYEREALMVYRDGHVAVERPSLRDLVIQVGEAEIQIGQNAQLYTRPDYRRTPNSSGWDTVIVGDQVVDVRKGSCEVPTSGFVLRTAYQIASPGDRVSYLGMENVLFAVQAGNSLVRDGRMTESFLSSFYNIYRPWNIPYPPSLYPLDYAKARAPRIGIGADADGKPMLLWAEGSPKLGYQVGRDSRGASLSEFASICAEAGMVNGVNLDGGGSAQILLQGKRALKISDRSDDGLERERSIPLGLVIR